eukprot:PLAT6376.1.p1 GENE.PLAT6376.1~~PLAT6376.1.p1  ORF type:complete len:598 (-),score=236.97 PLAT6376.1:26-1765(-)
MSKVGEDDACSSVVDDAAAAKPAKSKRRRRRKKKSAEKAAGQAVADPLELPGVAVDDCLLLCDAVAVRAIEGKGRAVVALRALPAGTTLLRETAAAATVLPAADGTACWCCFSALADGDDAISCHLCGARTCSACGEDVHRLHSRFCLLQPQLSTLAKRHGVEMELLRLVSRWLLPLAAATDIEESKKSASCPIRHCDEAEWATVDAQLDCHSEERRSSVTAAVAALYALLAAEEPAPRWSEEQACTFALSISCNAHAIELCSGSSHTTVGFGLFPRVALFNHSCAPNCSFSFHSTAARRGYMVVRTAVDVSAGEELCVRYEDLFQGRAARQSALARSYFFDCCCRRCVCDDASAIDNRLRRFTCPCGADVYATAAHDGGSTAGSAAADAGKEEDCEDMLPCSACELTFPLSSALALEERVAQACASADKLIRLRKWEEAAALLNALLTDVHTATAAKKKGKKKKMKAAAAAGAAAKMAMHPMHVALFPLRPLLLRCCNKSSDFYAAAAQLRLLVAFMDEVQPGAYLEKAMHLELLAETLDRMPAPRRPTKRSKELRAERAAALARAQDIRRITREDGE